MMEGQYCVDLLNNTVLPSKIYSPGPDPCTSCTCEGGTPTFCKVITCATPKNCRLVHPHTTCCNFECHDVDHLANLGDLGGSDGGNIQERVLSFNELTLRFVVIAFTVFISMSLVAFLVHRLKTRKPRGRQSRPLGVEDNRIGYIEGSIRGSIRYLPEYVAYEPPHPLWKPHGYFPPGEAPPPYEEAVAAARAEAALQNIPTEPPSLGIVSTVTVPYHRTIPLNLLSGNSHATTTTTAVIVRSNVHYDTLPQASQTTAVDTTRHPSLSRTPTLPSPSLPAIHPPLQHPSQPGQYPSQTLSNSNQLERIKSAYLPSPKTPSGRKVSKATQGSKTGATSSGSTGQSIYANVPVPVNTTSFITPAPSPGACKERTNHSSHATYDKAYEKCHSDRLDKDRSAHGKTPHKSKCDHDRNCDRKCEHDRGKNEHDRSKCDHMHDYVYLTKLHEGERSVAIKSEGKVVQLGEHAHHGHKKHRKLLQGTSTVQRNLTMPKASKTGKGDSSGKNLHTNYLALEKQYDQILKNGLKQLPPLSPRHNISGLSVRPSVSTISSSYTSHHSIPNYFTSPSLLPPPLSHKHLDEKLSAGRSFRDESDKLNDVIKPPSIYKSSTTPTMLSHLSSSNPILSSLDSNDEDFIDECENCRSDLPSAGEEARMMSDLETMTLQRAKPNCYEEFSASSLTLPTNCRVQRPSPMSNGPPPVINRFSSILSQSSLSEEDD